MAFVGPGAYVVHVALEGSTLPIAILSTPPLDVEFAIRPKISGWGWGACFGASARQGFPPGLSVSGWGWGVCFGAPARWDYRHGCWSLAEAGGLASAPPPAGVLRHGCRSLAGSGPEGDHPRAQRVYDGTYGIIGPESTSYPRFCTAADTFEAFWVDLGAGPAVLPTGRYDSNE